MYYNPSTDRAISIDEIARQCRDAISRGRVMSGVYVEDSTTTSDKVQSKVIK